MHLQFPFFKIWNIGFADVWHFCLLSDLNINLIKTQLHRVLMH